jgi:hypothetical protein
MHRIISKSHLQFDGEVLLAEEQPFHQWADTFHSELMLAIRTFDHRKALDATYEALAC